ncbi:MAG: T9SS type A sorting domain-containing protein [Candidatus Kapabacteria bacterium]|nr:T9SS type A sorting domain-containing protein [Candidatus Kapabacteria bacterium]
MKNFFYTLIAFFIITVYANAQINAIPFLAKEGYGSAKSKIVSKGFTNPQLVCCLTLNKSITYSGIPVTINFDETSGKSQAWFYFFRDNAFPDSIMSTAVVNLGIYATLDYDLSQYMTGIFKLNKTMGFVKDTLWIESSAFASKLSTSNELKTYRAANPNPDITIFALLFNTYIKSLTKNQPYWTISIQNGANNYVCAVDAFQGMISCPGILAVQDNQTNSEKINGYPNPSSDKVFVKFNSNEIVNSYEIFNSLGNKINSDYSPNQLAGQLEVSVSGLSNGAYFLKIICNGTNKIVPINVEK